MRVCIPNMYLTLLLFVTKEAKTDKVENTTTYKRIHPYLYKHTKKSQKQQSKNKS